MSDKELKIKLSAICDKCGDKAKLRRDGEWNVFDNLDCDCGGRYNLQLDKPNQQDDE